jgi:hypothetical protein
VSGPCSDGNACTTGDTCQGGVCTGGAAVVCTDENVCNGTETCNPLTGECVPGVALDCDDRIACTLDSCDNATGCAHVPDDALCTGTPPQCASGFTCDAAAGCVAVPEPDGTECAVAGTPGYCRSGLCVFGCVSDEQCNDGIDCTLDRCDPVLNQCLFVARDALCDDGRTCNGREICSPLGGCQPGAPFDCDDGIDCMVDSCDPVTDACRFVANDRLCDDQDPCTLGTCDAGAGGCVFEGFEGPGDDGDACM